MSMRPRNIPSPRCQQLQGHVELGMGKEALALARTILMDKSANMMEFDAALEAILIHAVNLPSWKTLIVSAFRKQPQATRKMLATRMLSFFVSAKDFDTAQDFMPRNPKNVVDVFFMMAVLLKNNRLREARLLAAKGERLLSGKLNAMDFNMLLDALADCYARLGDWDRAAACWHTMHLDGALGHNGLRGLVQLHAVQAILAVDDGLKKIRAFSKKSKDDTAIMLPGNEKEIVNELETELRIWRKALEIVVSPEQQKDFGLGG